MANTVEDVTGRGAGKAMSIQQESRHSGSRFATRGKAIVVGVVAVIACGILFGIFSRGQRNNTSQAQDVSDAPGMTHPDLGAMRAPPKPQPTASSSSIAPDCEQYNNSPWPCSPKPKITTLSDAEKKHRQWMMDESYKFQESKISDQLAAYKSGVTAPLGRSAPSGARSAQAQAEPDQQPTAPVNTARTSSVTDQASANSNASASDLQSAYLKSLGGNGSGVDSNKAWQQDMGKNGSAGGYLHATRQQPVGDYELFAGSIIPATMITAIDSDLPGTITASVRRTVYDSRDPTVTMIPQGSKLVGEYNSMVQYGQQRLMVIWNELIFPDGSTLDLKGMSGVDQIGEAGFYDQVNNHYLRVFGSAILISLFGAAAQLSQPQNSSVLTSPSVTSQATGNLATQLNTAATNILNKNLNIAPTLNIRPGYSFNVMVNRTIVMQPWDKDK